MTVSTDKLPQDVLAQDVPVGGAVDGRLAPFAVPSVIEGIVTTREVPTLRGNAGSLPLAANAAGVEPLRVGLEPRRRMLHVSVRPDASTTAYVVMASTREQAMNGDGLALIPGRGPYPIRCAGEVWFAAVGAPLVITFFAELDQG